ESETLYQQTDADTWVSGRRLEMLAAGWDPGDLWLQLHNEAGWHAEKRHWEAAATIRAVQTGLRVVVINATVGNPNEHTISMADTIIKLAAQNPQRVRIGIHDGYFSVFGDRKYPWYLGRWQASPGELGGGHSYESYRQAKGYGPVRYVVTEAGAEDIADDHPFTSKLPRTGSRQHVGPVHANDAAWAAVYGAGYKGKDAQYINELKRANRKSTR